MLYFVKATQSRKAIVVSEKPMDITKVTINGKEVEMRKPAGRMGFAAIPADVTDGLTPGQEIPGSDALKIGDNNVMRQVTDPDGVVTEEPLKNLFWVEVA